MKKVIFLASERSGTNLLRTLLGNHPDIDAPVAPHFLDAFNESVGLYGDLKRRNMPKNSWSIWSSSLIILTMIGR
jgi:hypothetical protein